MALIKSISGIRGTIGGKVGEGLSPLDIVKFTAAYGTWIQERNPGKKVKIVVGRDARISGLMVESIVLGTLQGLGIDIINLGFSTTPTVELAVPWEKADGGIILTASHNPKQWNALKLLNERGEFISAKDGEDLLNIAEQERFTFAAVDDLGAIAVDDSYMQKHIDHVLGLKEVDVDLIKAAKLKVVCDCVNSTGGLVIPHLLKALGVAEVTEMYCDPTGEFPHNPEPLAENLKDISAKVIDSKADVGFVVDPDVDRLAMVNEDGSMFGEEYTLVAVADHILSYNKGAAVSNLSSTRALRDVAQKHGCEYFASAVGEVNVVELMKKENAVIGGEGNGGVIFPASHYGRDALVGIGLFLTLLAKKKCSMTELKGSYTMYYMSKNKIQLTPEIDVDEILAQMAKKFSNEDVSTIDGVKIDFATEWVHLRKSNTEPIIRVYSESDSQENADRLAHRIMDEIAAVTA